MVEIRKTNLFARWLDDLRDLPARARVQARIERLAAGNPRDVEPVGEGVSELRINYGPGYRVYFKKRGQELIILLAGGDKSTQAVSAEPKVYEFSRSGHAAISLFLFLVRQQNLWASCGSGSLPST